jgi:hypothetical protein
MNCGVAFGEGKLVVMLDEKFTSRVSLKSTDFHYSSMLIAITVRTSCNSRAE